MYRVPALNVLSNLHHLLLWAYAMQEGRPKPTSGSPIFVFFAQIRTLVSAIAMRVST